MDDPRWGKGREWRWVFILALVLLLPSAPAASSTQDALLSIPQLTEGNKLAFYTALQQRVRVIALKASEIYSNACVLLNGCNTASIGQARLRLICGYQKDDNMTCESGFFFNTSFCTLDPKPGGKVCENLLVNYKEANGRLPNVDDVSHFDSVRATIFKHICILGSLKDTLKASLSREDYLRSGLLYFGSIAGVFVSYPTLNDFRRPKAHFPFDCKDFDPRFRPWFAEASSPTKKVSILVDLTNDIDKEHQKNGVVGDKHNEKRLDVLNRTLSRLLKTFRADDTVSFTTFPATDLDVAPQAAGLIEDGRCINVSISIGRMSKQNSKEDLSEGIKRAVGRLGDMWNSSPDLERQREPQVLLVFTRGRVNVDVAASVINSHNVEIRNRTQQNVAVFIYGVDVTSHQDFENYTTLAAAVNGIARNLGIQNDPLLGMYSYFNYLAQFNRNMTEPYFVHQYRQWNVSGHEDATSIILPVFDSRERFVGVAAMDLRLRKQSDDNEGLVNSMAENYTEEKIHDPRPLNPNDTLNMTDCSSEMWACPDGFDYTDCDTPAKLLIKEEHVIHRRTEELAERCVKCCGNCGSCTDQHGAVMKLWARVIIAVAAIIVVICLAIVCLTYRRLCARFKRDTKRSTAVTMETIKLSKY